MARRSRAASLMVAAGIALAGGLALAAGSRTDPAAATEAPAYPAVRLQLAPDAFAQWFARGGRGAEKRQVDCVATDERGVPIAGKAALRGFSRWHHTAEKPALRVELKSREVPVGIDEFELTRPEDVLAVGNWLPEQLAKELGLITSGNEHVGLWLDGRDYGVYLRSYRPGPLLARLCRRAPGTFFKGDAIGERVRVDLWRDAAAWRRYGDEDPAALAALAALLEDLASPASPASLATLAALVDPRSSAAQAAVLALTGSIHTDRIHNHMLFFRPARGDFEVVPWDCNSFGTHAIPTVPVDVVQHPLAAAWSCDPRWVHRRNVALWQLLQGTGSAANLERRVDALLQRIGPGLRSDPGLGYLQYKDGGFQFAHVAAADLPGWRDAFGRWVQQRERYLCQWFAEARVHVQPHPDRPGWCIVAVSGNVGVVASSGSGEALAPDLGAEELLLPGLGQQLELAPQHQDGTPLLAPFAPPAPLYYELRCAAEQLTFKNAHTGAHVSPTMAPAEARPTRSVHPWHLDPPAGRLVRLGPGDVELATTVVVPGNGRLLVEPGTTLRLAPGVGILCLGDCELRGTAAAPIRLLGAATAPWGGVAIVGPDGSCRIDHVVMQGGGAWRLHHLRFPAMLTVRDRQGASLAHVTCSQSSGDGLALDRAEASLRDCGIRDSSGSGILALASRLQAERVSVRGSGEAALSLADTEAALRASTLADTHEAGVHLADRSRLDFRGGSIAICRAGIDCTDESVAVLQDVVLRLNHTGWTAGRTTPFYRHGGIGYLVRCRFDATTTTDAELGPQAQLFCVGTELRASPASAPRVVQQRTLPAEVLASPPR